jgi:hypothetical protein
MPRVIVSSRYLKSGAKSTVANLIKYIATRETVEKYTPKKKEILLENYTKEIEKLIELFPESKNLFEYADYESAPTIENSAELITEILERNADKIYSREKLLSYMAERPGVEKRGKHGLFSQTDSNIVLAKVMRDVQNHTGNIWSHVVSLKREDAERLGYNTPDAWRNLVLRNIAAIAEESKIDLHNLKWHAAFHNTAHHPHMHLVLYSANPKQGFLTKESIANIRSKFANDIFKNELSEIYQKQTQTRDLIKIKSREKMRELLKQIADGNAPTELLKLMLILKKQLQNVKGKKVYGYLPKNVKDTVNSIVKLICDDENIAEMYNLWCELEQEKYATYTNARKEIPPLDEQQVFKSIKNDIIKQIDEMEFDTDLLEIVAEDTTDSNSRSKSTNSSNYKPRKNLNNDAQLVRTAMSMLNNFAKIISDNYERKIQNRIQIDSKLKRAIQRKKQALGMKCEQAMEQSY